MLTLNPMNSSALITSVIVNSRADLLRRRSSDAPSFFSLSGGPSSERAILSVASRCARLRCAASSASIFAFRDRFDRHHANTANPTDATAAAADTHEETSMVSLSINPMKESSK